MDLCGFTQPSVLCMLCHRWRLPNFGKTNLVGVVSGIVSGQAYGYIYIQIRSHTGCVVLSGTFFVPILHTLVDTYQIVARVV